jgi:hypothetical protein
MSKKTKKKKVENRVHVSYNRKIFLAPDSLLSMAAMHTKIKPCGEAQIRISDCNNTIKLWNDMNDKKQIDEMLTKIDNMMSMLSEFKKEILIKKTI